MFLRDCNRLVLLKLLVLNVLCDIKVEDNVAEGQDDEAISEVDHLVRCALDDMLAHDFAKTLLVVVKHLWRDFPRLALELTPIMHHLVFFPLRLGNCLSWTPFLSGELYDRAQKIVTWSLFVLNLKMVKGLFNRDDKSFFLIIPE